MFVLITRADLRCLRQAGAVPSALLDRIESEFSGHLEQNDCTADLVSYRHAVLILQPGDGPGVYAFVGISDGTIDHEDEWGCRNDYGAMMRYWVFDMRTCDRVFRVIIPLGMHDPGG